VDNLSEQYTPRIGFMQGRLVKKYNSRYQAFPPNSWRKEFEIASQLQLAMIEFIADFENEDVNPFFLSNKELDCLGDLAAKNNLEIVSICADYFMRYKLIDGNTFALNDTSLDALKVLLANGKYYGIKNIVLPFVDESSISSILREPKVIDSLRRIIDFFEEVEIECSLELDLPPDDILELVYCLNSEFIKINYDIGNSAALGFDCSEELNKYGHLINDIHLKDRILRGGPVFFGKGSSNFDCLFEFIYENEFSGPIIMQSYRDEEGLEIFEKQLIWLKERYLS
jgi:L-ribulose-5-phosphate 3-epimerase